jgi:hypothetical protein
MMGLAGKNRDMDARLTQRRFLICALAIVALASATTACGGGRTAQAAPKDPPLSQYNGSSLSFSYPSTWTASKPILPAVDLHFHPIVYLSTQPVHAPCTTKGNETSCALPIDELQPGGVFAWWEPAEIPVTQPVLGPGKPLRVDGHPARIEDKAGGNCSSIGADRTITIEVEPAADEFLYFNACLREPGVKQAEKSIDALLASTKFASQQ